MLDGFVREQKEEIIGMYLTEFNEERAIRGWRQEGLEEGREEGARQKAVENAKTMLADNLSPEKISQYSGLPLEQVLELQKELAAQPAAAQA